MCNSWYVGYEGPGGQELSKMRAWGKSFVQFEVPLVESNSRSVSLRRPL